MWWKKYANLSDRVRCRRRSHTIHGILFDNWLMSSMYSCIFRCWVYSWVNLSYHISLLTLVRSEYYSPGEYWFLQRRLLCLANLVIYAPNSSTINCYVTEPSCSSSKHPIVFNKLAMYVITGVGLDLIGTHLTSYSQSTSFSIAQSCMRLIKCAVPETTIIERLLLVIYISGIVNMELTPVIVACADDTNELFRLTR